MKRICLKLSAVMMSTMLLAPAVIHAQKEEKDKEKSEKKNLEQIIITRKGDSKDKVVVEINGDKVTVNGKPIEDMKDGDITVNRHVMKDGGTLRGYYSPNGSFSYNWNDDNSFMTQSDNSAMLGVSTEKVDEGVQISSITDESAAEKAGLKEDDIITKVDDKKVESPDDLTRVIRSHKPGDKITVTYLRDKKEMKATAELTKWKGMSLGRINIPNMDYNMIAPTTPRAKAFGQYYAFSDRPKLGLSVQDTDDGKGVKVIDVDDEGNAKKAGIKEDDVILSINDKEVNSADEVARLVRENREKPSMMIKLNRGGKTQNIEVHIPRKLKTADL
jgi:serine protease Do